MRKYQNARLDAYSFEILATSSAYYMWSYLSRVRAAISILNIVVVSIRRLLSLRNFSVHLTFLAQLAKTVYTYFAPRQSFCLSLSSA
jgi:hypothetical protein